MVILIDMAETVQKHDQNTEKGPPEGYLDGANSGEGNA